MNTILTFIATLVALFSMQPFNTPQPQFQRIATGNYHDYMVVNTCYDRNDWFIENPKEYLVYNDELKDYISIFDENELVQVVFDTKGTKNIHDDVVIKVRSIDD